MDIRTNYKMLLGVHKNVLQKLLFSSSREFHVNWIEILVVGL